MAKNSNFTRDQRTAYYSGMGYAVADAGRRVDFTKTKKNNRSSFLAGFLRGKAMMERNPGKYPKKYRKGRSSKPKS